MLTIVQEPVQHFVLLWTVSVGKDVVAAVTTVS